METKFYKTKNLHVLGLVLLLNLIPAIFTVAYAEKAAKKTEPVAEEVVIPPGVPPHIREKLERMPPAERRAELERMRIEHQARMQSGRPPMGPGGMPPMMGAPGGLPPMMGAPAGLPPLPPRLRTQLENTPPAERPALLEKWRREKAAADAAAFSPNAPSAEVRKNMRDRFEQMSPEERRAMREVFDQGKPLTPEQRNERRQQMRAHFENMTPEQRQSFLDDMNDSMKPVPPSGQKR